jgi:hypothetical protein
VTDRREPVKIEVPKDESVRLGRVGLIALAGFVIGIVWPRLAGMQLVPSAPAEDDPRPKELASAPKGAPAPKHQAAQPEKNQPVLGDRVKITETVVTSCDNPANRATRGCDDVQFDGVARSRLLTLAACPAAAGRTGLLSIGFDLNFEKDTVSRIRSGKSTSFDDATTRKLVACVEKEFGSATLEGIEHAYNNYTVFYKVELMPEAEQQAASEGEGEAVVEASGRATVGWQVALIRKEPREGEVVARILSGTNVIVTGRQGDWYRVKYDARGNEGWVYRSAIGL